MVCNINVPVGITQKDSPLFQIAPTYNTHAKQASLSGQTLLLQLDENTNNTTPTQ